MNGVKRLAIAAIAMAAVAGCTTEKTTNVPTPPAVEGWNLWRDFSETSSTSGAWTYGWDPTAAGSFVAMGDHVRDTNNPAIAVWRPSASADFPVVAKNTTGDVVDIHDGGQNFLFSYAPAMMVLHPGPTDERAVVRWRSPVAGPALVEGYAVAVQPGGSTDVIVRQNGVDLNAFAVANSTVNPDGTEGHTFQYAIMLNEGDTVDFSVGYGANQAITADSTALDVTITQ